jgi:hypothetical protein
MYIFLRVIALKRPAGALPFGALLRTLLMQSTVRRLILASEAFASLFAAGVLSCGGITEPPFPANAVPMQPPRVYAMWWQLTQTCSGITADFASVRWYVVPNVSQISVDGHQVQGYWWSSGNRIAVVGSQLLQGQLVRHEMLHALTGPEHTHKYFIDKCGGVVACEADCVTEAGDTPPPPVDAPTVNASVLSVETSVQPPDASISTDSGWVGITVTARNIQTLPVWVRMTPVAPGSPAVATFGYVVECISGGCGGGDEYRYLIADKVGFSAGQVRRYLFDRRLEPGTYALRGFFNVDTISTATFQISSQ